jgi:hypothetical protein
MIPTGYIETTEHFPAPMIFRKWVLDCAPFTTNNRKKRIVVWWVYEKPSAVADLTRTQDWGQCIGLQISIGIGIPITDGSCCIWKTTHSCIRFSYDIETKQLFCTTPYIWIIGQSVNIRETIVPLNKLVLDWATRYILNNVDLEGVKKVYSLVGDNSGCWYHYMIGWDIYETHRSDSLPTSGIMTDALRGSGYPMYFPGNIRVLGA